MQKYCNLTTTFHFHEKSFKMRQHIHLYNTKRNQQVISEILKILFQPNSSFISFLQSYLIYLKLRQFAFSRLSGY